jgi:hypothetical protein
MLPVQNLSSHITVKKQLSLIFRSRIMKLVLQNIYVIPNALYYLSSLILFGLFECLPWSFWITTSCDHFLQLPIILQTRLCKLQMNFHQQSVDTLLTEFSPWIIWMFSFLDIYLEKYFYITLLLWMYSTGTCKVMLYLTCTHCSIEVMYHTIFTISCA